MHRLLSDWVYDIQIITTNKRSVLKQWSEAIDEIIYRNSSINVLDLVALSFNSPNQNLVALEEIINVFKSHDSGFRVKDKYALQILSGATLISILDVEEDSDDNYMRQCITATAILTASFGKTKKDYRPSEILQAAIDFINNESLKNRQLQKVVFDGNIKGLVAAHNRIKQASLPSGGNNTLTIGQVKDLNQIVRPTLELLPLIPTILRNQDILQEESEMAWWVLAGFSKSAGLSFKDLSPEALPIIAAFELAQKTRILPSGVATRYLIKHLIESTGRQNDLVTLRSLGEALKNIPNKWLENLLLSIGAIYIPSVTALLYLAQQVALRGSHWSDDYFEKTGVSPDTSLPADELGYTFYEECLVMKMHQERQ